MLEVFGPTGAAILVNVSTSSKLRFLQVVRLALERNGYVECAGGMQHSLTSLQWQPRQGWEFAQEFCEEERCATAIGGGEGRLSCER